VPVHDIVRLEASALDACAAALSAAFQADPLQAYTFPDAEERRRLSPLHFRAPLRYGLRFGEVHTTAGAPGGAAVWLPPGQTTVTPERAAAAGFDALPAQLGADAADRFFGVLGFAEPLHVRDMPEPHWYTMVVGVAPEHQGRGLGRALLQPVLDRADADGVPCYLETAQPANVTFYERLGFRVLVDTTEPISGLRLWTFRRDPRRA
jgi:GNAT superfamily N-acetyltransferase